MKKEIVIKSNGEIVKVIKLTLPSKDHLQSQIKYPHKVYKNKKKYDRKRDKKVDES